MYKLSFYSHVYLARTGRFQTTAGANDSPSRKKLPSHVLRQRHAVMMQAYKVRKKT